MFSCKTERFIPLLEKLQTTLALQGKTVSTAESCTGGLVSSLLTYLPGSSNVFQGGICAYHNEVKIQLLGVKEATLLEHGAVSAATAAEMAAGACHVLQSDYAVSITGIAGPAGATAEKPVGTIWCGIAGPRGVLTQLHLLGTDRTQNRADISHLALTALYDYIKSC